MKLKYNFNGVTNEIPLSTKKPAGKRLTVRHNGQNYYAGLVETSDASASNLHTSFNGLEFAIQQQQPPQITDLAITPPTLAAMQGQSATATITAIPNEQVAGLSFSLDNTPSWITISDDVILIEPSDNDLGQFVVTVFANDTGSDASASAPFVAEALLRPIKSSGSTTLQVSPDLRFYNDKWPPYGTSLTATIQDPLPKNATVFAGTTNYSDDTSAKGYKTYIRYYPNQQTAYNGKKYINVSIAANGVDTCVYAGTFPLFGAEGVETVTTASFTSP